MPVVPFSQRPAQPAIPESMMPDDVHIDMAAAQIMEEHRVAFDKKLEAKTAEEKKKLDEFGVKGVTDQDIFGNIGNPDFIPYGGTVIDATKLSPKQLKGLGVKY